MPSGQEGHATTVQPLATRGAYRDQCEAAENAVAAEAQAQGFSSPEPPPKWLDTGSPARSMSITVPPTEKLSLRITEAARIEADGRTELATLFIRLPLDRSRPLAEQRKQFVHDSLHAMAEAANRLAAMEATP